MHTSEADIVVVHQSVDSLDLAANIELFGRIEEVSDGWMLLVAAKNFLSLSLPAKWSVKVQLRTGGRSLLVWLVDVIHGQDG